MRGWERCLKFGEGRGGGKLRCVVGGGREGTLSSLPAYLAALKGVMEAVRGGYIVIIIIITRSRVSSSNGRTIQKSNKLFFFSPYKRIPRSREEILKSSLSSNRRKRRETGLLD